MDSGKTGNGQPISGKTVERLSLYRRILENLLLEGETHIFSHQLSSFSGGTAAQVRQDMRVLGYSGSPSKGYEMSRLKQSITDYFDLSMCSNAALIGVGNLGRALLAFFRGRHPNLDIVTAFDKDESKVNRIIHGCRCLSLDELPEKLQEKNICIGIIAVPKEEAQHVADNLVENGILGILNFAPVKLRIPAGIYIEHIDLTMAFEKVAFFAHQKYLETHKGEE